MAQILVRQLEDDVKRRLKQRADKRGVSMEAEARLILREALLREEKDQPGLGTKIAELFKGIDWGDEELAELPDSPVRPVDFTE